ncbi:hypothetical protein B7494_g7647 [Chlorociboria aeruginascens]|nr:hypothetical protein B7494_g7647 [Chlorociboria aeruginascens]
MPNVVPVEYKDAAGWSGVVGNPSSGSGKSLASLRCSGGWMLPKSLRLWIRFWYVVVEGMGDGTGTKIWVDENWLVWPGELGIATAESAGVAGVGLYLREGIIGWEFVLMGYLKNRGGNDWEGGSCWKEEEET